MAQSYGPKNLADLNVLAWEIVEAPEAAVE